MSVEDDIFTMRLRTSRIDVYIFSGIMFVTLCLFIISIYNIYREKYATDPTYLGRVRSIVVATAFFQIQCFSGYWLNVYAMYESAWIIWLTISTFSIALMGVKFGESYLLLVNGNNIHAAKIPNKKIILTFTFWFVGCCIDLSGTILGFFGYHYLQAISYAVWEFLCCISISFVIYILVAVRKKFNDIMRSKALYKHSKPAINKNKAKKKKNYLSSVDDDELRKGFKIKQYAKENTLTTISSTGNIHNSRYLIDGIESSDGTAGSTQNSTQISITASINTSNTLISRSSSVIESEIKRMRNLIVSLVLLILLFGLNAFINFRWSVDFAFNKESYHNFSYDDTPTSIVLGVYFPYWTLIQIFVLQFSWIPSSQMREH